MFSLKKWWPTPVRSLFLFLVWLLLNNSVALDPFVFWSAVSMADPTA